MLLAGAGAASSKLFRRAAPNRRESSPSKGRGEPRMRRRTFLFLRFFPAILTPLLATGQGTQARQLIRDVRVFDGERVLEHRSVLIQNGNIRWVRGANATAAGAEVTEGAGRTLLPGLIDAHVHMPDHAEAAPRQALTLGVTTQLDMFSGGERFKAVKELEAQDRADL